MEWTSCVRREGTIFPLFGVTKSFSLCEQAFEVPFNYRNVRFVDYEWWYKTEEYEELKKVLRDVVNPPYIKRITEKHIQQGEELKKYVLELVSQGHGDLYKKLQEYIQKMHSFYGYWWMTIPAGEIIEKKVREIVEGKVEFGDLMFTTKKLELNKEQEELARIGVEGGDIENHAKQYGWITCTYHFGDALMAEDFLIKMKEMDCQKVLREIEEEEKRKEEVLERLQKELTEEEYAWIEAMHAIIYYRNYQKETVNECQHKSEPFLMQVAESLGLSREEFFGLTPYEVLEGLQNGMVTPRTGEFAIILEDGKTFLTEDVEKHTVKKEVEDVNSFAGSPACPGKVEGTVRVIMKKEELADFKEGEILVTSMTSIDYVHAMRKAKGIITDEGGITCHAAIFSRELGIPCVIGTKDATKVLKTGDVVEVDATKGTVRKTI